MSKHEELVVLVRKIISCAGSELEIDAWLDEFQANVPHPAVTDLIYYGEGERTAEEIVGLALGYRPVPLPRS